MSFLNLVREQDVERIVQETVTRAIQAFGGEILNNLKHKEYYDMLIKHACTEILDRYIKTTHVEDEISWTITQHYYKKDFSLVTISGQFLVSNDKIHNNMNDEQFWDMVKSSMPLKYDLVSTVFRLDRRYSEILNIAGTLEARLTEMEKSVVILENVEKHRIKFENKLNLVAVGRTYATSEVGLSIKGLVFLDDVQNTVKIMTWNGHVSICNDVFEYKPGVTEEDILKLFKNGQFQLSRLTTLIASWLGVGYEKFQQDSELGKITLDGRDAIELFFVSPRVGI